MRIASVGILYQFMGPAAAEGFFHDFSGWFIFMLSLGILLVEMVILKRILPGRDSTVHQDRAGGVAAQSYPPLQKSYSGLFRFLAPQILIILVLMGVSAASVQGVADRNRTALTKPFSQFPEAVGGWTAKRQTLEKIYLDALELNDYLLADFRNERGEVINGYVAFSDFQAKGKATHSPSSCLPGSGWELQKAAKIALTDGSGRTISVNRAMMVMGSDRRLTYYWFDQRGRILTEMYQIKLFNFVDSVIKNRTDGALVRLITPLGAQESPEAADVRLKEFFKQFNPTLSSFLPTSATM
jgi:exosortase D (VPLPA-CTERM-specific)